MSHSLFAQRQLDKLAFLRYNLSLVCGFVNFKFSLSDIFGLKYLEFFYLIKLSTVCNRKTNSEVLRVRKSPKSLETSCYYI